MNTIKVTRKTARLLDVMLTARRFNAPTTWGMAPRGGVGMANFYVLVDRLEEAGWVGRGDSIGTYVLTEDGTRWAWEALKEHDLRPWWKRIGGSR